MICLRSHCQQRVAESDLTPGSLTPGSISRQEGWVLLPPATVASAQPSPHPQNLMQPYLSSQHIPNWFEWQCVLPWEQGDESSHIQTNHKTSYQGLFLLNCMTQCWPIRCKGKLWGDCSPWPDERGKGPFLLYSSLFLLGILQSEGVIKDCGSLFWPWGTTMPIATVAEQKDRELLATLELWGQPRKQCLQTSCSLR